MLVILRWVWGIQTDRRLERVERGPPPRSHRLFERLTS